MTDALTGQVSVAEGDVRKSYSVESTGRGYSGRTTYYYHIGDVHLAVSGKMAYDAMIDGLRYRAYYTPRSKKLVAIEPL